ncbi:hypothetical protein EVAR_39240_1 [Eumeta japonica]|uniref:Uncharacterized protein n=1 Tax=Eumeta variegata TaxID=151549 RepID=A0A4C1Y3B4_EUMVA|nr:hypothetical protein EVAR_39240_1 [Eumeta japonica]
MFPTQLPDGGICVTASWASFAGNQYKKVCVFQNALFQVFLFGGRLGLGDCQKTVVFQIDTAFLARGLAARRMISMSIWWRGNQPSYVNNFTDISFYDLAINAYVWCIDIAAQPLSASNGSKLVVRCISCTKVKVVHAIMLMIPMQKQLSA